MGKTKYVGCKIDGCVEKHRSRGFCRKHYRIVIGEGKRRYQKVKNSPSLTNTYKEAIGRYRRTEVYRKSKAISDRKYYLANKKHILEYKAEWNELKRFGTSRKEILSRDNYKCTECHSPIVNDLVIHHINGKGRSTATPDNDLANLTTLCRSCHMRIHMAD